MGEKYQTMTKLLQTLMKLFIDGYQQARQPDGLPDAVTVKYRNTSHIHHREVAQAGLSRARFEKPDVIAKALDDHGLDPFDPVRVRFDTERGYIYVWANEDVMVISTTNPFNTETLGYMEAMGIEGEQETVDSLFESLEASAIQYFDGNSWKRAFI